MGWLSYIVINKRNEFSSTNSEEVRDFFYSYKEDQVAHVREGV